MNVNYLMKRNDVYYFRIVVPTHLHGKFAKNEFWRSLRTRSRNEAVVKVAPLVEHFLKMFDSPDTHTDEPVSFERLKEVSATLSFEYMDATAVDAAPIPETINIIGKRMDAFKLMKRPNDLDIAAMSGAVENPALTFTDALKRYKELSPDKWLMLDERSKYKKWRPFTEAVNSFTEAMGEVDVLKLRPKQGFEFAAYLVKKVAEGKMKVGTARKKIMWLKMIMTKVFQSDYPELSNPFDKVTIESDGEEKGKRLPFTEDEVQAIERKLADSDANEELKALMEVAENTGATCKELAFLAKADIFLDAPIPYISIRPNEFRGRVKSGGVRHRDIPLIGKALEAMKLHPEGFPRYRRHNGSEALSAAANKLIKQVAPKKSFYSYRHRIADRLRNSKCQDTMKNSIMGHASEGMQMHYGEGYDMPNKLKALKKALLKVN